MIVSINDGVKLTQTYGDYGLRFAGPDLLDYAMIFEIKGGEFEGERLRIDSSYHPCCGTLEVNAELMKVYKRWRNKLDGCEQHRRDGGENSLIKKMLCEIESLIIYMEE